VLLPSGPDTVLKNNGPRGQSFIVETKTIAAVKYRSPSFDPAMKSVCGYNRGLSCQPSLPKKGDLTWFLKLFKNCINNGLLEHNNI
jgi:hypothetical protein